MTAPYIPGLTRATYQKLGALGYSSREDFRDLPIGTLLDAGIGWPQVLRIIRFLVASGTPPIFRGPTGAWDETKWHRLVTTIVDEGIVSWQEVAVAVLGELNPPQVGTSLASNSNIKVQYPDREAMRNVMEWFYSQDGKCRHCGRRIHLEIDHIVGKNCYTKSGRDPAKADRLDNFQLLCRRCNVVKRDSHKLGGLSFATAQAALMWILLVERPASRTAFYVLCRTHGLTMASIRFDEAWAMAEWLAREGMYELEVDGT